MEAGDRRHDVKEIGCLALEGVHDVRVTYGVDPVGPADVPGQVAVVDESRQGPLRRGVAVPVGQLLGHPERLPERGRRDQETHTQRRKHRLGEGADV